MPDKADDSRLERAAEEAIRVGGRDQLRQQFDQFEQLWQTEQAQVRSLPLWRRPRNWLLVAAVLLIFVLAWSQFNSASSPTDLFARNFEPYRPPTVIRGDESGSDDWQEAVSAYQAANYTKAAALFESVQLGADSLQFLRDFYLANSYLAMNPSEANSAIAPLQSVLQVDNLYQEQARWLLALTYLATDQLTDAQALLQQIVEAKSYQWEAAEDLLSQLD